MWLGSGTAVTVAVASSCSSDLTSSLGTSICHGGSPKKQKKKKKKERKSGITCGDAQAMPRKSFGWAVIIVGW